MHICAREGVTRLAEETAPRLGPGLGPLQAAAFCHEPWAAKHALGIKFGVWIIKIRKSVMLHDVTNQLLYQVMAPLGRKRTLSTMWNSVDHVTHLWSRGLGAF